MKAKFEAGVQCSGYNVISYCLLECVWQPKMIDKQGSLYLVRRVLAPTHDNTANWEAGIYGLILLVGRRLLGGILGANEIVSIPLHWLLVIFNLAVRR